MVKMGFCLSPPQPSHSYSLNTLHKALDPSEAQHVGRREERRWAASHFQPSQAPPNPCKAALDPFASRTSGQDEFETSSHWLRCFHFRTPKKGLFVNGITGRLASPLPSSTFCPNPWLRQVPAPTLQPLLALDHCPTPPPHPMLRWGRGRFHPQTQALLFHPSAQPSALHLSWWRFSWHSVSPRSAEG